MLIFAKIFEEKSEMKKRKTYFLLILSIGLFFIGGNSALACACCAAEGEYMISFRKPEEYEIKQLKRIRFGKTATLFTGEADVEDAAKGILNPLGEYSLSSSFDKNLWKLVFRDGSNKTGTLNLQLAPKMLHYQVDTRDGGSGGNGPLLYKEWRFESVAKGAGFFQPGFAAPAKYFLVLQGRGNACTNAEDFKYWRLEITGKKADYAFYGELADPLPDSPAE